MCDSQIKVIALPFSLLLTMGVWVGCDQSSNPSTTVTSQSQSQSYTRDTDYATELYEAGRYQESADAFRAVLDQHPDDAIVWAAYGFALMNLNLWDESQAAFEKSMALNPDWPDPYQGLGILARWRKDYDAAYNYYNKALSYDPDDPQVLGSVLIINLRRGEFDLAVRQGERAVEQLPNDPNLIANLSVAYHYQGALIKRDATAQRAESLGYPDMDYLKQVFAGEENLGPE